MSRLLLTLHLPISVDDFVKLCKAFATVWPRTVIKTGEDGTTHEIWSAP